MTVTMAEALSTAEHTDDRIVVVPDPDWPCRARLMEHRDGEWWTITSRGGCSVDDAVHLLRSSHARADQVNPADVWVIAQ